MSFILDALKKSESERQQHSRAEFAGVPTSSGTASAPRWLWVLGVLLTINLAVLIGLLLKPDAQPEPQRASPPPATVAAVENTEPGTAGFAEQVAQARLNPPPVQEARPVEQATSDAPTTIVESSPASTAAALPAATASRNAAALPTIHQLRADGVLVLPDLHLDIHVYSENPDDRFVFINMSRQDEGSQLDAGPVVDEITADGVVLTYQGLTFLLPRD
jgi:general secretion pathway protein B